MESLKQKVNKVIDEYADDNDKYVASFRNEIEKKHKEIDLLKAKIFELQKENEDLKTKFSKLLDVLAK